ncbi:MAG: DUF4147 domain-containing protein [Thermomicrobiales bacterium]
MSGAREQIQQIFQAAVDAVDPRRCVCEALSDHDADLESASAYVIAFGKAAGQMARGAVDALDKTIAGGIVVTKEPVDEPIERFNYFQGSHPVPDERSMEAGEAVLEFASTIPDGAPVFCLISGGGSALVEALKPGLKLQDLQELTSRLLRAGAPIEDLNAVRSRLSTIKGGGLLTALHHARVVNLIVSDVLGDNLQAIASGPTVRHQSGQSAEDVLARYSIDFPLPPPIESTDTEPVATLIVASLEKAIRAAASAAKHGGLRPVLLSNRLQGEAREVGATIATILRAGRSDLSPFQSGDCLLAGGETTVTVRGDGKGGRNTEAALAAALELQTSRGITIGFLATDGDDGVTRAAGAIVDGATISTEDSAKARKALDANDSYSVLARAGAVWEPGATGTNVNDLVIGIIE